MTVPQVISVPYDPSFVGYEVNPTGDANQQISTNRKEVTKVPAMPKEA